MTSSGIGMYRSAVLTDCRASDNGCWSSVPRPAVFTSPAKRDLDTAEVTYCGRSCRMLNQWVGSCGSRAMATMWQPPVDREPADGYISRTDGAVAQLGGQHVVTLAEVIDADQPRAGTLSVGPSGKNPLSGRRSAASAGDLSGCGEIRPRSARSPVFAQNSQWAGLLWMAALTSAAQRPNTVVISPSTGTGAEISS